MRRLLAAAVFASACAPPPLDCVRQVLPPMEQAGLAVVGYDAHLDFTSPLSTCVSDSLGASAEAWDGENQPVAVTLGPVSRDSRAHAIARLTLRPTKPGLHLVRVAFEPSLGAQQVLLPVAEVARVVDRPASPAWRPERCHGGPWPVDDDTLACERRDAGGIDVLPRHGGGESFEGAYLVVADEVLWSVTPQGVLERRIWRDGGLAVTAALGGFLPVDTAALHGERLAGRWRASGRFAVVAGDTTLSLLEMQQLYAPPPTFAVPHADGGAWFFWGDRAPCLSGSCLALHGHAGVEAGYRWLSDPLRVVDLAERPVGRELPGLMSAALAPPREGFVRVPPVAVVPPHDLVALGLVREGSPVLVALEKARLQRVGLSRATALGADGGLVILGL